VVGGGRALVVGHPQDHPVVKEALGRVVAQDQPLPVVDQEGGLVDRLDLMPDHLLVFVVVVEEGLF